MSSGEQAVAEPPAPAWPVDPQRTAVPTTRADPTSPEFARHTDAPGKQVGADQVLLVVIEDETVTGEPGWSADISVRNDDRRVPCPGV